MKEGTNKRSSMDLDNKAKIGRNMIDEGTIKQNGIQGVIYNSNKGEQ